MDQSLKENDRSSNLGTGEGSFSMAGTLVQGGGLGIIAPTSQTISPCVREAVSELFPAISVICRIMRITGLRALQRCRDGVWQCS
jgi:hypothetical protein